MDINKIITRTLKKVEKQAKQDEKKLSPSDRAWRQGYDLGTQQALKDNGEAIKIGRTILDVLDNRYEYRKEDY